MADWLIDWLIHVLADWITDWLAYWLIDQLACLHVLGDWPADWLINWLIGWLTDCLGDLLLKFTCDQLTGWHAQLLADWLTVWQINWLTDSQRLIDWLIGWLIAWLIGMTGWLTYWSGEIEKESMNKINFRCHKFRDHELSLKYWSVKCSSFFLNSHS